MIDTHCHILPAVDDGSDSMPTSMMMAAMAADDGVAAIIATPHFTWGEEGEKAIRYFQQTYLAFSEALKERGIPIAPYFGAEVLIPSKAGPFTDENFPCLAETKYALVEFFFDDTAEHMTAMLSSLVNVGILPIVAHPERYFAVQKDKNLAHRFTELGCYLQINKGSLFGGFGKKVKAAVLRILEDGDASLVGSDAHDTSHRTPGLRSAYSYLASEYGEETAKLLTEDNPALLLKGMQMKKMKQ